MIKDTTNDIRVFSAYFDDSYPQVFMFFESGYPNKVMMITEDPYFGLESELITKEKYLELKNKLDEVVQHGEESK